MAPQYDEEAAPLLPSHPSHYLNVPLSDAERRTWRGGLLCCFPGCDMISWATLAFSLHFPCVAFGFNVKRSLGHTWWRAVLYVLLCGIGGRLLYHGSALYAVHKCNVHDSQTSASKQNDQSPECNAAVGLFLGAAIFTMVLSVIGAIYAAHHRSQIRQKFGIAGCFLGDCCAWYWCGACALCQETRTLWHNNVVDGVWLGPIHSASDRRAQTLPCYTAPTDTKMSC